MSEPAKIGEKRYRLIVVDQNTGLTVTDEKDLDALALEIGRNTRLGFDPKARKPAIDGQTKSLFYGHAFICLSMAKMLFDRAGQMTKTSPQWQKEIEDLITTLTPFIKTDTEKHD